MRKSILACAVLAIIFSSCGEKCPVEPCREPCGYVYGEVMPPGDLNLPPDRLEVRSLTAACGLNEDLSFCLPGLEGTGTGVLVLAAADSIPVMLGYVFPKTVRTQGGDVVPLDLDAVLRDVILTESGDVKISASSTALALVLLNHFVGGATVEDRVWFATRALRHHLFQDLEADVTSALEASPLDALDSRFNPGVFAIAARIVSDLSNLERAGGAAGGAPYVIDAPGDYVRFMNPAFVYFEASIAAEGGAEPDTLLLLRARGVENMMIPETIIPLGYRLGSGRFDIDFYKGFGDSTGDKHIEIGQPGRLATMANAELLVWNVVTVFAGLPEITRPGTMDIGLAGWAEDLSDAIAEADAGRVVDLALGFVDSDPGAISGWFEPDQDVTSEVRSFLAATRVVLSNNIDYLDEADAARTPPFYSSLLKAVSRESLLVCQRDGDLVPCETAPVLSGGSSSPVSGMTDCVFTFSVNYYDTEGQPPASIATVIDSSAYPMSLVRGEPADGRYSVSTTLPAGRHNCYFECFDTHGDYSRLPQSGDFPGPVVKSYPELTSGQVIPSTGSIWDQYTFSVHYEDADFDPPGSVSAVVDGHEHPMDLVEGAAFDGRYEYRTGMTAGPHTYHFECTDRTGASARLPGEGDFDGPYVPYAPELSNGLLAPPSGTTQTLFTFEVDYMHADGVPPMYVAVCIDEDVGMMMTLVDGLPQAGTYRYVTRLGPGDHAYYFEARDTLGLGGRLPQTGSWSGPMVYIPEGKNPEAKVAVHVRAHNAKAGCDYGSINGCFDIVYTISDFNVDAFPVFFNLTEYTGVEYGMTWPASFGSGSWKNCADFADGDISWPGDGVRSTWASCRTGVAVPGYLWLYAAAPGLVCVCPNPASGRMLVIDCDLGSNEPIRDYCAGVAGAEGEECWPYKDSP